VTVSKEIKTINGKKFYIHPVKEGETLYSIGKAYKIDPNEIAYENPEAFEGLTPGQNLKIPFISQSESNGEYKKHVVKKGETLYAISKQYNLNPDILLKHNPEAVDGLKIGQVLKIPTGKPTPEVVNTEVPVVQGDTSRYIMHTVNKGETLYAISKKYNVKTDDILRSNPGLTAESLSAGTIIKIPRNMADPVNVESEHLVLPDTTTLNIEALFKPSVFSGTCEGYKYSENKETFVISLLLPISADAVTMEKEEEVFDKPDFKPKQKPFLEFYEGFLLAADTFKSRGVNIELRVFDVKKDSASCVELVKSGKLKGSSIIVGPVYNETFQIVSDYARQEQIPVVFPINSRNDQLYLNQFVFHINTTLATQMQQATRYMASFNDKVFIVVHNGSDAEKEILAIYKKKLIEYYSLNFQTENVPYKEILYSSGGISAVEQALVNGKENVIIVPSSSQVFVIGILTKLQPLLKKHKIILASMPSWKKFEENIELEYLHKLNTRSFNPFYTDYTNGDVKRFVRRYRKEFNMDPSKYALLGYDIGFYFLAALEKYGKDFPGCVQEMDMQMLQTYFSFQQAGAKGGMENIGTYILHHHEESKVILLNKVGKTVVMPLIEVQPENTNQ
jgi:LysM repeat protein/ABC-type branched-subunit amino acid transport system substrate-binding protein